MEIKFLIRHILCEANDILNLEQKILIYTLLQYLLRIVFGKNYNTVAARFQYLLFVKSRN